MIALIWLLSSIAVVEAPDAHKLHQSFWGSYNEFAHDDTTALSWYNRLLEDPNTPDYCYRGIINLFARNNNNNSIIFLMPRIESAFTSDTDMQLIFAKALYNGGFVVPADEKILKLTQQVKDHPEVALLAAQLYMRKKELENAILVIKDYVTATPVHPHHGLFYFMLALLYTQLQQQELAQQAINKALELQPNFAKAWLFYGVLHEKEHQWDKALRGYVRYLAYSNGQHPEIAVRIEQLIDLVQKSKSAEQQQLSSIHCKQIIELLKQAQFGQAAELLDSFLSGQTRTLLQHMPTQKSSSLWDYAQALLMHGIHLCRHITNLFIKPLLPAMYNNKHSRIFTLS